MSEPERPDVGRASRRADSSQAGHGTPETSSAPTERAPSGRPGASGPSLAGVLLALALAAFAVAGFGWYRLSAPAATPVPVEFEVEPGWGAGRVAAELEGRGLVRDGDVFSLWLRLRGVDRQIGEGVYELSPHLSAPEVARRLAEGGRPRTVQVVVPEGYRIVDVAERLAAAGIAGATAALDRMREPGELRPTWLPEGASLEGYLFPASYELEAGAALDAVLGRMLERFRNEVGPAEVDRLVELGLHVHEWVTLASMVQAEAADDGEMPVIAGVFLNRRDRGMPFQSDPTAAYGLGKDLPELDAVAGDLRQDHPWNTYTREGLPAGPIGNPGRAALQAVLRPQRTNGEGEPWLYFLHGVEGDEPIFRPNTTLADHERDIDLYLR